MKRTLRLTREALTELITDDLRIAVGGGQSGLTCPVKECTQNLSDVLTCVGTYQCPTAPC